MIFNQNFIGYIRTTPPRAPPTRSRPPGCWGCYSRTDSLAGLLLTSQPLSRLPSLPGWSGFPVRRRHTSYRSRKHQLKKRIININVHFEVYSQTMLWNNLIKWSEWSKSTFIGVELKDENFRPIVFFVL